MYIPRYLTRDTAMLLFHLFYQPLEEHCIVKRFFNKKKKKKNVGIKNVKNCEKIAQREKNARKYFYITLYVG